MGKHKPEPIEATYNSACDDGQRRILFRVSGGFIGELKTDDMKSAIKIIRACNDHDQLKSQKAALLAACKKHSERMTKWLTVERFKNATITDLKRLMVDFVDDAESAIKAGEGV